LGLFPHHNLRPDGQFVGGQFHSGDRHIGRYTLHLEEDLTRAYDCYPLLRRTFTLAHTGFGGLLGNGLIREEPYPYFAATSHGTRHAHTRGLYLAIRDPGAG